RAPATVTMPSPVAIPTVTGDTGLRAIGWVIAGAGDWLVPLGVGVPGPAVVLGSALAGAGDGSAPAGPPLSPPPVSPPPEPPDPPPVPDWPPPAGGLAGSMS